MAFEMFRKRMEAEGLPELVIETFRHQYEQLVAGESGLMPESALESVDDLPDLDTLPAELSRRGQESLSRCVMIKLNGGLGTSMGLDRPKSLLEIKDGMTFLDVIARHAVSADVRLVLMNSFSTQSDSIDALRHYPELAGRQLDFLQHKVPKVRADDLEPLDWPMNRALEWNPPGHGDLYTALQTSGMLDALLAEGRDLAFVSNADNLGASIDARLVGYMVSSETEFLMEVADRTEADRKGGHLARSTDGGLVLREAAQCAEGDRESFQDIERHRYFNTNNIWLDLKALKRSLSERGRLLVLPLIRNAKLADPRVPDSPRVFQLETAMGSAIGVLPGAGAIRVARERFAPVKTTDDLLAVRADANILTSDFRVAPHPDRKGRPTVVALDRKYYGHVDQLEARFPAGPPSLVDCDRFVVEGDAMFGADIRCVGDVLVRNESDVQLQVKNGSVLGE